jgi:phage terminase small subunit
MSNLKKLNDRHYIFVERYLENGNNAAEAYRFAYNVKDQKQSSKRGSELLNDPLIKTEITKKQEELRNKYKINKETIIKELVDIINFNVVDVQSIKKVKKKEQKMNYSTGKVEEVEVEKDEIVLQQDLDSLSLRQQKNIKSIEMTRNGIKITYYDKMDAIEKLNKMLGFYEEKINFDTRIDTGSLSGLSMEQLLELLKESETDGQKNS